MNVFKTKISLKPESAQLPPISTVFTTVFLYLKASLSMPTFIDERLV